MSQNSPRRNRTVLFITGILIGLLLLMLVRCARNKPIQETPSPTTSAPAETPPGPAIQSTAAARADEVLTPATVQAPAEVSAGSKFAVTWTGPANAEDFITIVRRDAAEGAYENHRMIRDGNPVELTAPMQEGDWELRYVATRSRKVLGRAPIAVTPVSAELNAVDAAVLGTTIEVAWMGPNNQGDYITVVAKDTPDGRYGNYVDTRNGTPAKLTLPPTAGPAELRYVSGQGMKVLARRPLTILAPDVSLRAASEVIAGTRIDVDWTGPNNRGDYITLVPKTKPDGQYGNYTDTAKGNPLSILVPIDAGEAELRYMTAQGSKVLGRRDVKITAAKITLEAPAEAKAGQPVSVTWTGPNNQGDYITLVPKSQPDGQYGAYAETRKGSPLQITALKVAGDAEVRYMSGQGAKVLARRPIKIVD